MDKDEPNYEVGYGKPPEHSRFKKGESGNPKGRPKGALNFAHVFRRAMSEKIWTTQDGKRRQMSKMEAAMTQLVNKAVKGDVRSVQLLIPLMPLMEDPAAATPGMTEDAQKEAMQVIYGRFAELPAAAPVAPPAIPAAAAATPTPQPNAAPAKRAPMPAKRTPPVPGPTSPPMPAKKSLPMKTTPALKKLQEMQND